MTGKSLGKSWMPNLTESPKDEEESFLWQALETEVQPKYYLSMTACLGILRRSQKAGKPLPPVLESALIAQAKLSAEEYKKIKETWKAEK